MRVKKFDELHRDIAADIERDGRSVMCIAGEDEDSPPFAFTVGNALAGLPELLMIGAAWADVLHDLSQKIIERERAFDDGELVQIDDGSYVVKIVNADRRAHNEYTILAGQYLGHENYRVQQVLVPDHNGRFPGDPGCLAPASFPMLGTAYRH